MTSTILSNRESQQFKSLYLWSLRRHMGISILYALLLFLIFPGVLIVNSMNRNYSVDLVYSLFPLLVIPLTMLFTLIFSALHFSYMHNKRRVDLFYSLPARRNTMLLARLCAAVTHVLVPLLANCLIAGLCIAGNPQLMSSYRSYSEYSNPVYLVQVVFYLCLAVLASLLFSLFISVCCGTTMDSILSILVINGVFPVLVLLVTEVSSSLLPGIEVNLSVLPFVYTMLCPYGSMASCYLSYGGISLSAVNLQWYTWWWIFFVAAMLAATLLINRRRKSESAENAWAFAVPNIVIRIVVSITAGLGGGFLIAQSMDGLISQFLLGMLLGAVVAHMVLEAIYSRGLRKVLRSFPYLGGSVALLVCYLLFMLYGMNGLIYRVPAASEVAQVTLSISDNEYVGYSRINHTGYSYVEMDDYQWQTPILTDQETVQWITALQEETLGETRRLQYNSFRSYGYSMLEFTYQLNDGSTLKRSYKLNFLSQVFQDGSKGQSMLEQILNSREYKESANSIFQTSVEFVDRFAYADYNKRSDYQTIPTDAQQKAELLTALRNDVLADTVEKQMKWLETGGGDFRISVEYRVPDAKQQLPGVKYMNGSDEYLIPDYYTNTRAVLERLEIDGL